MPVTMEGFIKDVNVKAYFPLFHGEGKIFNFLNNSFFH